MRRATASGVAAALGTLAIASAMAAADAPPHPQGVPRTLVVCPGPDDGAVCAFHGGSGIQEAVDRARDGDTVLLKAGIYKAQTTRDVAYQQYTMPGFIVVAGRNLDLVGEAGTVLQGSTSYPSTGIVLDRARVAIRDIALRSFAVQSSEDDRYDGHGIFVIDSAVRLDGVTMEGIAKMGLSLRGASTVEANGLVVRGGHIGVWLEESSHLTLRGSRLEGNDSAGICAYVNSSARVYDSVIAGNEDDGLYAEDEATIFASGATITDNRPYGARAVDGARIYIEDSRVYGNERNFSRSWLGRHVRRGPGVVVAESDRVDDATQ